MRFLVKVSFMRFSYSRSFYLLILGVTIPAFFLSLLYQLFFSFPVETSHFFPILFGIGFFLSALFQKKGVIFACLLATTFFLIDWKNFSQPSLWRIFLFLSCFLTFYTVYLVSQILFVIWQALIKRKNRKISHFSWIKKAFVKETQEYQSYIHSLRQTVELLTQQNRTFQEQVQSQKKQMENIQSELRFVLQQKQELIKDVFATRRELALQKMEVPVAIQSNPQASEDYKKLEEQWKHEKSLHQQLRSQFNEKTELLTETRKELFKMETEVFSLQKNLPEVSDIEKGLIQTLQKACLQMEELQEENLALEKLITSLSAL